MTTTNDMTELAGAMAEQERLRDHLQLFHQVLQAQQAHGDTLRLQWEYTALHNDEDVANPWLVAIALLLIMALMVSCMWQMHKTILATRAEGRLGKRRSSLHPSDPPHGM